MGVLSVSLTFVGYVLVYAAVANHGRFATSPWTGVYQDAYDDGVQASLDAQQTRVAAQRKASGTKLNSFGFPTNDPAYRLRGPRG